MKHSSTSKGQKFEELCCKLECTPCGAILLKFKTIKTQAQEQTGLSLKFSIYLFYEHVKGACQN